MNAPTQQGRLEEFGATPWTAVLLAILLAVGASAFHAGTAAPSHGQPVAIHAARTVK
jgi:hypothetical protein